MTKNDIPLATERRSGLNRRTAVGARKKARGDGTFPGAELTKEEVEFCMAMDRYKRAHRRPWPTCSEVLHVLKSLGYRKAEAHEEN